MDTVRNLPRTLIKIKSALWHWEEVFWRCFYVQALQHNRFNTKMYWSLFSDAHEVHIIGYKFRNVYSRGI